MTRHELIAVLPKACDAPLDERLLFVPVDDLTVVFRAKPQPAIALPQSRARALQSASARQELLEKLMPLGPVLPFRPGVAVRQEDAPPLIRANRPLFAELASRFEGQVQFQVTVRWDDENVLRRFRDAPELAPHFRQGRVTPEALKQAVLNLARRLEAEMAETLFEASTEILMMPLAENMLVNAVVLLPETDEPRLDRAVEAIDAVWTDGLSIRQIGPAPAASFAMLDVTPITPPQLEGAANQLGLGADWSPDQVAMGRRVSLLQSPEAANAIRAAAKVLTAADAAGCSEFCLCHVVSEGQSQSHPQQEVA